MHSLDVLYQDPYLIAVAKPSGLLVHPSHQAADRVTCMSLLRDQVGRWVYPAHRLDRGTSGALLFSFDPATAALISKGFRERDVKKSYLAVVRGWAPEAGAIDHPITDDDGLALPAQTSYRALARVELPHPVGPYDTARYSLVRAEPLTGRTHQIRRHMKHINHPVVGDTVHGEGRQNRLFRELFGIRRLLLHAERLSFEHPHTGELLVLEAPPPEELRDLLERLGMEMK